MMTPKTEAASSSTPPRMPFRSFPISRSATTAGGGADQYRRHRVPLRGGVDGGVVLHGDMQDPDDLKAFREGTVDVHAVGGHAAFLIGARRAAAAYLRDVQAHFPAGAGPALGAAAGNYDRVAARITELRALCATDDPDLERASGVLASALEAERAALAGLQQALEARE